MSVHVFRCVEVWNKPPVLVAAPNKTRIEFGCILTFTQTNVSDVSSRIFPHTFVF